MCLSLGANHEPISVEASYRLRYGNPHVGSPASIPCIWNVRHEYPAYARGSLANRKSQPGQSYDQAGFREQGQGGVKVVFARKPSTGFRVFLLAEKACNKEAGATLQIKQSMCAGLSVWL
jgi:hypothetical protein